MRKARSQRAESELSPKGRVAGRIALGLGVGAVFLLGQALLPAEAAGTEMVGEPITPIPRTLGAEPRKAELGRRLFSDTRLSGGNEVSCASCHLMTRGGADGLARPPGLSGKPGATNTLTVLNAGLNPRLNWDGRSMSLEQQALAVVESPNSMGGDWDEILEALARDAGMVEAFDAIYPDGLTRDNVANAIAEFQRTLITPDAPFDRYLRGEPDAISGSAKAGYELFKSFGCSSCHQGVNVGGNMLQVFGIFGVPNAASEGAATPGSAKGTGISELHPVFRVPSLRNVAQTAPYFHDGSVGTLGEAIRIMAQSQLGQEISQREIGEIEDFLNSLTGEFHGVSVGDF